MTIKYMNIIRVALIVAALLLIPLALTIHDGAVEGVGWNWTPFDFAVMGSLMFVTGLAMDFAIRKVVKPVHRLLTVSAILLAFLIVWAQLAVGAVSQLVGFLLG